MLTRRSALACLLCAATALGSYPAVAQDARTPIKVRVATVISSAWLPLWVAKDKGIFLENGLDVDIMTVQNNSTTIGALGRQIDISAATTIDIVKAAAGGLDVVGVSGNTIETSANQQMRLIAGKDSGITTVEQLRGKTLGTPTINGAVHVAAMLAIKGAGVEPKDVRFLEMTFPNMADQLRAKRVDAVEAVEPFASALKQAGHVDLGDPMLKVADPVTLTCWMANGEWARAHPDVVKSWRSALDAAKAFIAANDGEARQILAKWTNLPDNVIKNIVLPTYSTSLTTQDVSVWIDATRDAGQLTRDLKASGLVLN